MRGKTTVKWGIVIAAILCVCIVFVLGAMISRPGDQNDQTDSRGEIGAEDNLVFSTEVVDLHFPARWKDQIWMEAMESDTGEVCVFYSKAADQRVDLFAVLFGRSNSAESTPVGVVDVNGEQILVSIHMIDLKGASSWEEKDRNRIDAMQEDLNYLVEKLHSEPGFSTNVDVFLSEDDLLVETPFVTLVYPGTWKDLIWTEFEMDDGCGSVTFYGMVGGADAPLFTVYFGGGDQEAVSVGYVMKAKIAVPVSVQMYPVSEGEDWTEEDIGTIVSMQEGVNDLLDHLQKTSVFSVNGIPAAEPEEDVIVTTPYLDLHFPGQWAEFLSVTQTEEKGHAVSFHAALEGKKTKLFTVYFDMEGDNSVPIGTIRQDNGTVAVAVQVEELIFDETWTTSEIHIASAMQECVNDVIDQLSAAEGFALM